MADDSRPAYRAPRAQPEDSFQATVDRGSPLLAIIFGLLALLAVGIGVAQVRDIVRLAVCVAIGALFGMVSVAHVVTAWRRRR